MAVGVGGAPSVDWCIGEEIILVGQGQNKLVPKVPCVRRLLHREPILRNTELCQQALLTLVLLRVPTNAPRRYTPTPTFDAAYTGAAGIGKSPPAIQSMASTA
eukprot:1145431-Pelagomonas_calceolata.AAC.13